MSTLPESADDRMWREIKAHLRVQSFGPHVSWEAVYRAKEELGYPLNDWENGALRRTSPNVTPIVTRKGDDGEDWWQR